jgi:hypothetical protein
MAPMVRNKLENRNTANHRKHCNANNSGAECRTSPKARLLLMVLRLFNFFGF